VSGDRRGSEAGYVHRDLDRRDRLENIPEFIDESYMRMQKNCARIAEVLGMRDRNRNDALHTA